MDNKSFKLHLIVGECGGIVNVEYVTSQVTYARTWRYIPGKPISFDYFVEDKR